MKGMFVSYGQEVTYRRWGDEGVRPDLFTVLWGSFKKFITLKLMLKSSLCHVVVPLKLLAGEFWKIKLWKHELRVY